MIKERNTAQKEAIQLEINNIGGFFDAEELYDKVSEKNKNIGIATIYRYLKHLKENNLLHVYICKERMIFSKNKESHCHFICIVCNKTRHIQIKSLDFLKKEISTDKICHFQIDVEGICQSCK